jgi:hypothetical protein
MQQKAGTMRARDFITELFQPGKDVNFKWSRPYQDEVNVLGKTPQGHELSINFWEITDDIVAIDFTIDADVEQDPDPDSSPKSGHELTRHGEEFAVFTQVVNAITQYLNKLPKNNVFFQVKRTEAQREPLYLKIANRVAKQLGFRHGTAQELEVTNPGLYNKFDNRYSKLLWYTNAPQSVAEGTESLDYQGNCTEDDVVDDIFGDVNNFANMVEKYGDEFTRGKLVVKYNPKKDVHYFYYKKQGVAENFADGRKFVEPNFDFEWEEAERYPEFVKLGKDAWIELAQKGKAVTINSAKGINNTDAADPDSFKSLVPAKQKRALAQLEKGTVEMPIVAVYSDGHKELIGGNTRLTAMMARDGRATVWAFRVPGKQGVAEEIKDNEFITELWDKPYAFINPYSQDEGSGYSFQTSDGRSGKVEMDHFSLKAASWFRNLDPDSWQGVSIEFTIQGGTMTSGQRDEIRIFSTVIAAAKDYFKNHNPDFVVFETDDHKKLGVYRRLIKMLTSYTPYPGWKDDALINDDIYNILNSGRIKDTIVLRRKDYIPWKKRVLGGEPK